MSGPYVPPAAGRRERSISVQLGSMQKWALRCMCLLFLVPRIACGSAPVDEPVAAKNVLVLYSFTQSNAFLELEPLKASLRAHVSAPVNFYVEYLDSTLFNDNAYRNSLIETVCRAHATARLDLVIAGGYPALSFALDYRERRFPGVPIVFVAVDPSRLQGRRIWTGVTGLTSKADVAGSLELALRFHPDTRNVVLLAGVSEFETYWNDRFRKELRLHHNNLNLIEVIGLPPRAALRQISTLPLHTIIFAQIASQDSIDSELRVFDLLSAVGQRFPTYSVFNYCFDHGCVGGFYPDQEEDGRRAGAIAARVLSGESPLGIPMQNGTVTRPMVDWRELRYWRIPESSLPAATIVLYRPDPFWQRHKWAIEMASVFVLAVLLLSLGVLFENRQRKRAEQEVARRLHVETMISQISSELTNTSSIDVGFAIQRSLRALREFVGVDRVSIFKLTEGGAGLRLRHSAHLDGIGAAPSLLRRNEFPWLFERLAGSEPVVVPKLQDLPISAAAEVELLRENNVRTIVIFPLRIDNRLEGMLSFAVVQRTAGWSKELLPHLEALSQVYASAFERELSQEALAESESRFLALGEATPAFIWMTDQTGKFTYVNGHTLEFTGAKSEDLNGNGWFTYVHPDDQTMALGVGARAQEQQQRFFREYRVLRRDGTYRWMFEVGNPRFNGEGAFIGFIGSALDVTDQQLAREALAGVSGQLIAAQEEERSHIARELHDDICQRLAMLSLRIEKAAKSWSAGRVSVGEQLEQIWQQCSDITGDVQALSHELHPSILDNLGLVTAVRSFCREFAEESGTTVQFTETDVPVSLPRAVSLSVFRVIQEALHNAAKYSGKEHFEVHLRGKSAEIELEIIDRGLGFDVANVKGGDGLGLISMCERIHILNGTMVIESKPNHGTRIRARVPVTPQTVAASASASNSTELERINATYQDPSGR